MDYKKRECIHSKSDRFIYASVMFCILSDNNLLFLIPLKLIKSLNSDEQLSLMAGLIVCEVLIKRRNK
jgi:hypothetical protein